jgi:hypothetical protein
VEGGSDIGRGLLPLKSWEDRRSPRW